MDALAYHGLKQGDGGGVKRILALIDEGMRLPTSALVAYYIFWKGMSLGLAIGVVALLFGLWVMMPPALPLLSAQWAGEVRPRLRALITSIFKAKLKVASKGPVTRWSLRMVFCLFMAFLSLVPLNVASRPDDAVRLEDAPGYEPYDAKITPDGRYLFVTYAHSDKNGMSRVDLESGKQQQIPSEDRHAHYVELFAERNLAIVNARKFIADPETGEEKRVGHLYYYSIDPFRLRTEKACNLPYPIRATRYVDQSILMILKASRTTETTQAVVVSKDFSNPCEAIHSRVDIPLSVGGAETIAFLDDAPELAWVEGEFGGDICLTNPMKGELLRCVDAGLGVWTTEVEPGAGRIWLSRQLEHKVDLRDSRTGGFLGSFSVNGTPRPITFDPKGGFAYVGMYFAGHVAVVDSGTLEVLRYVRSGYQLRELLVDPIRRTLIAVSAEGVFTFDLEGLNGDGVVEHH
jgi:DNA-binding beta-propeller fold protein YncE